MAKQLNMDNRDPNNMNLHVQVMFDDVLAEVEGAHSAECVWRNSHKCFTGGQGCCYKLLTYLFGLPLALYWGCVFACISFGEVWCQTPILRTFSITLYTIKKMNQILLAACLGPITETVGLIFSRIHITNSQSEPPLPIGALDRQGLTQTKRMK